MEDLTLWAPRLESAIVSRGVTCVSRVAVVATTGSTQDAAREMAAGRPGLLLVAGKQTGGRGRLGRAWSDERGLGVAATFVLGPEAARSAHLPIAAGVAACRTVEAALGRAYPGRTVVRGAVDAARGVAEAAAILSANPLGWAASRVVLPRRRIGLRWPNDVVTVRTRRGRERKVAGVLIEADARGTAVGVGINVLQGEEDWPEDLRGRAASLRVLRSRWGRLEALERLLIEMDAALKLGADAVARRWQERDILVGTHRTFEHGGRVYSGKVEAIQPTSEIQLRTDAGDVVKLPALTTSMVHG